MHWGVKKKVCASLIALTATSAVWAGAFEDYALQGQFNIPANSKLDVLGDGSLIVVDDAATVYAETSLGSRSFASVGSLAGADFASGPYGGAAFVRVSPDGSQVAVGNGGGASYGNYQVGVFDVGTLAGGWFGVDHYDAEWMDDATLALSAGGVAGVTALDVTSSPAAPTNPTLVTGVGGASSGVTFDADGNLYTGNGFQFAGPSETGTVKGFSAADIAAVLGGGSPINFETGGELIVDALSGATLGFDAEGNLYLGGGDAFGSGDAGYFGLVEASVVVRALSGGAAADFGDSAELAKYDPSGAGATYLTNYNAVTGELYAQDGATVYVYAVPEPATAWLLVFAFGALLRRRG